MDSLEGKISQAIAITAPREVYDAYTLMSDAEMLLQQKSGYELTRERTLIHDVLLTWWFARIIEEMKPRDEYAFVALAAHGRQEMTPLSDVDVGLIFRGLAANDNPLVRRFQDDANNYALADLLGFTFSPSHIYSLSNIPSFDEITLNSFLDMRHLYGSESVTNDFHVELKRRTNRAEHMLHNLELWRATQQRDTSFDRGQSFNIKNDWGGLRTAQIFGWMMGVETFDSLKDVFASFGEKFCRNYERLLAWRCRTNVAYMAEQRRGKPMGAKTRKTPKADELLPSSFFALPLSERTDLQELRRFMQTFTEGMVHTRFKKGVILGKRLRCTFNGLSLINRELLHKPRLKSEALYDLLRTAQQYRLPVDPAERHYVLHDVNEWLFPTLGLGALFCSEGSFLPTLRFLTESGAASRLFPGYELLAVTPAPLPSSVASVPCTRYALLEQGLQLFEQICAEHADIRYLAQPSRNLAPEARGALTLAHLVNHLASARNESPLDVMVSFSSFKSFTPSTRAFAEFLLREQDLLMTVARQTLNADARVKELTTLLADREHAAALTIFTYLQNVPLGVPITSHLWRNIEELYGKLEYHFRQQEEETSHDFNALVRFFGTEFMSSRYQSLARPWRETIAHHLHEKGDVYISLSPDRSVHLLSVASEEDPALMSIIAGQCTQAHVNVQQALLFSHPSQKGYTPLASSFFLLSLPEEFNEQRFKKDLVSALTDKTFIEQNPAVILEPLKRRARLEYLEHESLYHLHFETEEDAHGILYAVTRILYDQLAHTDASATHHPMIYSAHVYLDPETNRVNDHFFFKTPLSFAEAEVRVREYIAA